MPQPISPAQVESEILRLSALLEETAEEQAELGMNEGEAEVAYKVKHARALLEADAKTVSDREALATLASEAELRNRRIAEALLTANQEKCRTIRAQLDALRTIAANVRGLVK